MTSSTQHTLHQYMTLLQNFAFYFFTRGSIEHFGREWQANRGCLLLQTPCPSSFGTAYAQLVEVIFSRICFDFLDFTLRTPPLATFLIYFPTALFTSGPSPPLLDAPSVTTSYSPLLLLTSPWRYVSTYQPYSIQVQIGHMTL